MYWWYALCQIYNRKIYTVITTAMMTLSFIVAAYAIAFFCMCRYNYIKAENVINGDYEKIYNIDFSNYLNPTSDDIVSMHDWYCKLLEMPELEYVGMYSFDEQSKVMYMSGSVGRMCGVPSATDMDYGFCLLGAYASQDYVENGVYTEPMYGLEYTVSGTLDKGSCFIGEAYVSNFISEIVCLDEYVILDYEKMYEAAPVMWINGVGHNIYFAVADGYDADLVTDKVINTAAEYGIDLYSVYNLNEGFDKLTDMTLEEMGETYIMPFLVAVCSCFAMLIVTLASYESNKHDTGIMLAGGMSRRGISMVYTFEILIKICTAYVLSCIYWNERIKVMDESLNWSEMFKIALPVSGVVGIIILAASGIPIYLRVVRSKPVALLMTNQT